ncbi:hypothetical protein E3Q02_03276 [Wallemia mellicola]|uniref:SRR1-like domain-containing protein n=1 Tax=Wallemia mellicola TaxID=1708541 RepID=A0AB38MS81_9BASI|nr:hypothetical protein E3Q12_00676 [Wallemia mellicola]TIC36879.1 hypothetical protein E3Q09_01176 [Wallemia mellicola]TIC56339.1 hypothetical protein E3Q04_01056 [Wallemia mellicola]TIC62912.1 hypothetical protein E3Q02_03276 [Wallemia mellicola]TIC71182.1 hypothetical protein E3Q03_00622 [Wallemia mellicola]
MDGFKYKAYKPKSKGGNRRNKNQLPINLEVNSNDKLTGALYHRRNVIKQSDWFKGVQHTFDSVISSDNWPTPAKIIALGLGSFEDNRNAVDQLVLLEYIIEKLQIAPNNVSLYDPVCTETDKDFVKQFGYDYIQNSDSIHTNNNCNMFLYMPHCDKVLYEATLSSYWSADKLSTVVLLGNDLSLYSNRQKDKGNVSLVSKFLTFSESNNLPNPPDDLINSFNELCFQYVPSLRARWLNEEYWNKQ